MVKKQAVWANDMIFGALGLSKKSAVILLTSVVIPVMLRLTKKKAVETVDKDFVELISEHQKLIHKVCNVYGATPEDRKDLFQDIVLQLWRSYPSFKEEARITTWLYRVALNTAITQQRKKKKQLVSLSDKSGGLESIEDDLNLKEDKQVLHLLISQLDAIEKSIILLYLEEKSYDEIAEIMGLTKTNVSVKLVRIKKKLEKKFKQYSK